MLDLFLVNISLAIMFSLTSNFRATISAGQISATALLFCTLAAESLAGQCNQPVTYPGFDPAPGFNVRFKNETYTVAEHLKLIGRNFNTIRIPTIGYNANLTEDDMATVCTDPQGKNAVALSTLAHIDSRFHRAKHLWNIR